MARTPSVVLLFGGRSSEHSISCVTAQGVLEALDRERYETIPVGVTREGAFVHAEEPVSFGSGADGLPEVIDDGSRVRWPESAAGRELTVADADGDVRSLGGVDAVFPILHGRYGEDGTVQGMLEMLGLPYVGDGVLASSLGMDKQFTRSVVAHAGLAAVPSRPVSVFEWRDRPEEVSAMAADLGFPVFVKPARAGSSIGVSKVPDAADLAAAIDAAFQHDDTVLVEAAVVGREIEVAVLGGRPGQRARASVPGEIVVADGGFYDFEAKYLDTPGIDLLCPAPLTDAESSEVRELALRAFEAISGCGLARVDFFLTDDGFVVNEVNTMPGFTPISMFPKCWEASGLSYTDLISELIDCGLAHGAR